MEGPLMARTCSKIAWNGGFSPQMVSRRSSHGGEEDGNLHLSFSNNLREIERWRSKKRARRNPRLDSLLSQRKVERKGRREEDSPFYRQWQWVPQLTQLLGLKTPSSRPRMDSTKKEELFVKISSFQKVYISRVSETLKIVSRFCAKRLIYPYH